MDKITEYVTDMTEVDYGKVHVNIRIITHVCAVIILFVEVVMTGSLASHFCFQVMC